MGAYYFEQSGILTPPENVIISINSDSVHIQWGAVTGATSYKVYSSYRPYSGFDNPVTVTDTTWTAPISEEKKFFRITANN